MNLIAVYTATGPTVKNTSPSAVNSLLTSLVQFSTQVNTPTDYTITYTPVNNMPAGAAFILYYGPQPVTPAATGQFVACQVTYNNVIFPFNCVNDPNAMTIQILPIPSSVMPTVAGGGLPLIIKISPITNPETNKVASTQNSMILTSYTDSTLQYSID